MTVKICSLPSRLVPIALVVAAFAFNPLLLQQSAAAGTRLHTQSPPEVLSDPVVKHCRLLAARRTDPKLDSLTTAVEKAAMLLKMHVIFDAVTTCRAALARYPNEPAVIIAQYNAAEALSVVALGMKFPGSEAEALAMVQQAAAKGDAIGLVKQLYSFYLGSAYEYGVGADPDRMAAMKWYAIAAEAGDPISKRELARLQASKQ
jgi:TPR repeat protein